MRIINLLVIICFVSLLSACGGGGGGDTSNNDTDGDGILNSADNCPNNANANQQDTDGDGIGDVCDPTNNNDTDGDGVLNAVDNCPNNANPGQEDTDMDGIGDACEVAGGSNLSLINAASVFVDQNSSTGTTITVQVKDSSGANVTSGGDTITLSTTGGMQGATLGAVTDNGNGTYSANLSLTGDITAVTVTGKVNNVDITDKERIAIKVSTSTSPGTLVALGEQIFTDENLSTPIGQSCATCHDVTSGKFIDTRANNTTSQGADPADFGGRNSPTVGYAAHIPDLVLVGGNKVGGQFWDGRTDSLEEQARQPFLDTVEMGNPDKATVIDKIKVAAYANDFKAEFGANSLDNVDVAFVQMSEAIAAFERSRIFSPFTSKWDAVQAGTASFTAAEARGFQAFQSGRCDTCHFTGGRVNENPIVSAQVFSNFKYENIGVPGNEGRPGKPVNPLFALDSSFRDFGAGSAPENPGDGPHFNLPPGTGKGMFKVPTLRNIAVTAPYMHNGIFDTLEEVIDFYNSQFPIAGINTDAEVPDTISDGGQYFDTLFETQQEKDDLKAFLLTLTDAGV